MTASGASADERERRYKVHVWVAALDAAPRASVAAETGCAPLTATVASGGAVNAPAAATDADGVCLVDAQRAFAA